MYLLKCHIENFGKFTDFDYQFNKELNVINKENGWGKTTLSIFIKAVFYGMSSSTKHNLDDNDRKMYLPNNNGKYGGYIDFIKDGKEYRIERYFGKTESADLCKFTDIATGNSHPEGTKSWGERLFGVNSDAFLRTLFLCQKDIDLSNNKSISDKIGNVYQETDDESIDSALKALEKKRIEIKHKNGKGGLIFDKKEKLSELKISIEKCKMAVQAVETIEKRVVESEKEIVEVEKQLKDTSELAKQVREVEAIKERRKSFDEKLAKKQTLTSKLAVNLKVVENSNATINDVQQKLSECSLISSIKNDIKESEDKLNGILAKKQAIYSTYNIIPTFNDLQELTTLSNSQMENNVKDFETPANLSKKNNLPLIVIILSALLLITGVVIAVTGSLVIGIVTSVVGFVGAIIGLLMYVTKIVKSNGKNNIAVYEARRLNIETQIISLKTKLGLANLSLSESIGKLSTDLQKLNDFTAEEKHLKQYVLEKNNQLVEKENDIKLFISQFNLTNIDKFNNDKEILNEIALIMRDIIAFEEEILSLDKELNDLKTKGIILDDKLLNADKEDIDSKETYLKDLLVQKRNNLSILRNNQKICYLEQERLSDLEQEVVLLNEEISSLTHKYDLVTKTIELLSGARNDLTEKFLAPMTKGVNDYLKRLTGKEDKIYLDSDYKVHVEIGGELKPIDYCSLGLRNIYALALRFAFIDEVYKDVSSDNRPFIILDDPFVNFDDNNLSVTLNAIKEIAKERQIIYFVCHDSRDVK